MVDSVELTKLPAVGEDSVGSTRNGGRARLGASELVASDDEGSGSRKRDIGRAVAATLIAPSGNTAAHRVLVTIDKQGLNGSSDGDSALEVEAANSGH
jgi:hypothetical protein